MENKAFEVGDLVDIFDGNYCIYQERIVRFTKTQILTKSSDSQRVTRWRRTGVLKHYQIDPVYYFRHIRLAS